MIAGAMMLVLVLGGAMALYYLLSDSAMDRLVHILRFDDTNSADERRTV